MHMTFLRVMKSDFEYTEDRAAYAYLAKAARWSALKVKERRDATRKSRKKESELNAESEFKAHARTFYYTEPPKPDEVLKAKKTVILRTLDALSPSDKD